MIGRKAVKKKCVRAGIAYYDDDGKFCWTEEEEVDTLQEEQEEVASS